MKEGLIFENEELVFYKNDVPYHAGAIEVDGSIYYIGSNGRAVKGQYIVHQDMTNGLLERGTYTFDDNYRLIKESYIAPRKRKKRPVKKVQKPKKGKRIRKNKITKKQKQLAFAAILTLCVLVFSAIVIDATSGNAPHPVEETFDVKISLPSFDEDILLCSEAAKQEYDGQLDLKTAIETGGPYRPFLFRYHLRNASGVLRLGETESLSDFKEYTLAEEDDYVVIDNLKVDTTYYYEVSVEDEIYAGSFHTAPATRFVSIPGLVNTRDIGGGITQDGKKVKQGLLIRGVELDGLVNASYFIPEKELNSVQETFGFQYDLDLRGAYIYNGQYASRLGVEHKFYDAPMYGTIFTTGYRYSLRSIFADLADADKYPMYLHCTWGKDRTGTIVFLLQGILNMSEEDMVREYRLTSYTHAELAESINMEVVVNGLKPYAGDTLQEKIVSFLIEDIGVTKAEIESIRSIFLEE